MYCPLVLEKGGVGKVWFSWVSKHKWWGRWRWLWWWLEKASLQLYCHVTLLSTFNTNNTTPVLLYLYINFPMQLLQLKPIITIFPLHVYTLIWFSSLILSILSIQLSQIFIFEIVFFFFKSIAGINGFCCH